MCSGKGMLSVGYCREMVYSFAALVFAAGRGVMTAPGERAYGRKRLQLLCVAISRDAQVRWGSRWRYVDENER